MPETRQSRQDGPFSHSPNAATSRGTQLALVGVIVLAFVGFIVGIQQESWLALRTPPLQLRSVPWPEARVDEDLADAIPATNYVDFDRRQFGPNRDWQSTLAGLPTLSQLLPATHPDESTEDAGAQDSWREVSLVERAERRAFEGAPPVVPHPIDQMGASSCLACHAEGRVIGKGVVAPMMSHGLLLNCTQCHVEGQSVEWESEVPWENEFDGFRGVGRGSRAWEGAPPTVPHSIVMRENCLSCHGPGGPNPLRTSHPLRVSCLQCHAPSAFWDQRER
jgi:nitrate reductase (cytochrome), electron transfer subunit